MADQNKDFLDAKKVIDEITEAFLNQQKAVEVSAKSLKKHMDLYAKLPSDYIKNLKTIEDNNLKVAKTEEAVTKAKAAAEKLEQERLRTQLQTIKLKDAEAAANNRLEASERSRNSARARYAAMNAQEKVDQQIINMNQRRAAIISSELAGAYKKLSTQYLIAGERVQNLMALEKASITNKKAYNKELKIAQDNFAVLKKRIDAADSAIGKYNRNVGNYPKLQGMFGDLMTAFGLYSGVQIFADIIKNIYETTKAIQAMKLALEQVSQTQDVFDENQRFLNRVAEQYGIGIQELTQNYIQFYTSAKDKLAGKDIQDIFESVSKAAGFMGLSIDQQRRAFLALNQMMSKGTIQAEELRGQLGEALPGAFGILAKSMGVTEKQLGKMMKEGQVYAAEVLPKFAEELEKAYGIENQTRVENMAAEQTRLTNAWVDFVKELNNGEGVIARVFGGLIKWTRGAIQGITQLMKSPETVQNELEDTLKQRSYDRTLERIEAIGKAEKEVAQEKMRQINESKESEKSKEIAMQNQLTVIEKITEAQRAEASESRRRVTERIGQILDERDAIQQRNMELMQSGRVNPDARSRTPQQKADWITYGKNNGALDELSNSLAISVGELNAIRDILAKLNPKIKADDGDDIKKVKLAREKIRANKDYLESEYNVKRALLEASIAFNTKVMNDESRSFDVRKKASLDLYADRKELADLDYREAIRRNKFRLQDDLRISEAEKKNELNRNTEDLAGKRKSADDSAQITLEAADRENGIRNEARNKDLLALIKYNNDKREIDQDYQLYLVGVLRQMEDGKVEGVISQDQIDGLRELQKIMANLSTSSEAKDFAEIAKLTKDIANNFEEQNLQRKLRDKTDEIAEYEALANRREELEIRLAELKNGLANQANKEEIERIELLLMNQYSAFYKESEAYQKLTQEQKDAFKALENYKVTQAQVTADKIKEIYDRTGVYGNKPGKEQRFTETLTDDERGTLETLIQNVKNEVAGASDILDEYVAALDRYKSLGSGFIENLSSKETKKVKELFDAAASGAEGADIELRNYLATLEMMKEYFDGFTDDFEAGSGFKEFFKVIKGEIEGFGEDWRVTFLAITEAAQEFVAYFASISQERFDRERANLDAQKDKEISAAGESAEARAEIERQYEIKRRAIQRREAQAKKRLAIFNAIVDTAQAVVSELAKGGYAAAILAGILGAAQIGIIEATSVPEFETGLEAGPHKGGLLLMNDAAGANYKEKLVTPSGKIIEPDGRNQLVDAPPGSLVYTQEQWQQKLMQNLSGMGILPFESSLSIPEKQPKGLTKEDMREVMSEAVGNMPTGPTIETRRDETGYRKYKREQGIREELHNARFYIKGKMLP